MMESLNYELTHHCLKPTLNDHNPRISPGLWKRELATPVGDKKIYINCDLFMLKIPSFDLSFLRGRDAQ